MKPSVIDFNGLGAPRQAHVATGYVAIRFQGDKKEVVRIEIVPPDE